MMLVHMDQGQVLTQDIWISSQLFHEQTGTRQLLHLTFTDNLKSRKSIWNDEKEQDL